MNGDEISEEIIDSEHYISRYIIKKTDTVARIRFIPFKNFSQKIEDYKRLHDVNAEWCNRSIDLFYSEILEDSQRSSLLLEDFQEKAARILWWPIFKNHQISIEKKDINIKWSKEFQCAVVELKCDESVLPTLDRSEETQTKMSNLIKNVYRYTGEVIFEADDLPF